MMMQVGLDSPAHHLIYLNNAKNNLQPLRTTYRIDISPDHGPFSAHMATSPKHKLLPLIPLARDSVLLPGTTLPVPVQNRPDIPALLSAVYSKAATPKVDASSILVGCVPLCSPLLSPEGQNLLEDAEIRIRKTAEHLATNPGKAVEKDLFTYGTVAKISGVQGRRPGDLALIVEGVRRFRIERFTQFKPYMEAEVVYLDEDGATFLAILYELY